VSDKQDIVEQLRLWSEQLKSLSRWRSGKLKFPQRITLIGEAADEIERLRKERDEARREVCEWEHHWDKTSSEQYYADKRGWDCFKDNA